MAKKQPPTVADKLHPAGSQVRPGLRRVLIWTLHSGKLVALLLAIGSGWGLYDALKSPRYEVRVVEAVGAQALTSQDVAALAAVENQRIWFVDADAAAARVEQSPYVEHAVARLILPDRLEVLVTERKPEVRWFHDGVAYAVTWEGLVVDRAGPPSAKPNAGALSDTAPITAGTPLTTTDAMAQAVPAGTGNFLSTVTIVDTTPNRPLKIGQYVDADALELARRVSLRAPTELPVPITRIEWDGGLGVSLIMGEGHQVVLGRSDDLDRKMATLRYLLNDKTAFSYLDLRPTAPYYRP